MFNDFNLPSRNDFSDFAIKWTPRVIVTVAIGCCGYYSLGWAYQVGLMARIDQIAIRILLPQVGYIGLGAMMPTVQWYSAWSVRAVVVVSITFIYGQCEKVSIAAYRYFQSKNAPIAAPDPIL